MDDDAHAWGLNLVYRGAYGLAWHEVELSRYSRDQVHVRDPKADLASPVPGGADVYEAVDPPDVLGRIDGLRARARPTVLAMKWLGLSTARWNR